MTRLVIGDIHGCFEELQELLAKAALARDDEIIALGDVVDRGPDSPRVFDFCCQTPGVRTLLGNHERKHVRSFRKLTRPALSQLVTRRQFGEVRYPEVVAAMDQFPRFLELPEAVLVHGFLEPGVPLTKQQETVLVGTMTGERYLGRTYDRPWYELYEGDKPVVVGHRNYLSTGEPFVYRDRVFGIDTGCCHGQKLTGLLLPSFRLVAVAARQDHWTAVKRQHAALDPGRRADDSLALENLLGRPDALLSWEQLQALLEALTGSTVRPNDAADRVDRLRSLADRAELAATSIFEHVLRENERHLAALRRDGRFDDLPPKEQGRAYAARIGHTPVARYLHLARRGELTRDGLRASFSRPGLILAIAEELGTPAEKVCR